jgi:hypothetical protein
MSLNSRCPICYADTDTGGNCTEPRNHPISLLSLKNEREELNREIEKLRQLLESFEHQSSHT